MSELLTTADGGPGPMKKEIGPAQMVHVAVLSYNAITRLRRRGRCRRDLPTLIGPSAPAGVPPSRANAMKSQSRDDSEITLPGRRKVRDVLALGHLDSRVVGPIGTLRANARFRRQEDRPPSLGRTEVALRQLKSRAIAFFLAAHSRRFGRPEEGTSDKQNPPGYNRQNRVYCCNCNWRWRRSVAPNLSPSAHGE